MPNLQYKQYEAKLQNKDIAYANAIGQFDRVFYEHEVGILPGSIGEFMRVGKRYGKGKNKKRVWVVNDDNEPNKENQPIWLLATIISCDLK